MKVTISAQDLTKFMSMEDKKEEWMKFHACLSETDAYIEKTIPFRLWEKE